MKPRSFRALVYTLTAEEGGGRQPLFSGYHSHVCVGDVEGSALMVYCDELPPAQGTSGEAMFTPILATQFHVVLPVGGEFELRDGTQVVARGRLLEWQYT